MTNKLNLLLPTHVQEMLAKETVDVENTDATERGKFLPEPVGYKILLILPEQAKTYESGIIKADQTLNNDEVASVVAFVAKLGPDCYKDPNKFPNGPWCKQGAFVVIRQSSGVRLVVTGKEMRLVNDDSIEAVVDDPRGIKRVGG